MGNYKPQNRKDKSDKKFGKPIQIEYSKSLLEAALGFVKVFGFTNIPDGVRNVLAYATKIGDLNQQQIDLADSRYHQEYEQNPLEKMFLLH